MIKSIRIAIEGFLAGLKTLSIAASGYLDEDGNIVIPKTRKRGGGVNWTLIEERRKKRNNAIMILTQK